jgi:hypothetical protein
MQELTLTYPEDCHAAVETTPQEFETQVRLMAALKMFELGKLSGKGLSLGKGRDAGRPLTG